MSLTPLDIHNKEFKKVFRGYDEEEVDDFLDQVIEEFERVYKENFELKEKLEKKEGNIEEYKGLEDTLKNTLVVAQQAAEDTRKNAEKAAEVIQKEAQLKADTMVKEAKEKADQISKEYENIESQVNQFKVKFKAFLNAQLELVEKEKFHGND